MLTDDQAAIVETVRDFAREHLAPNAVDWDRRKHFPVDVLCKAADLGLGGVYVAEEAGGSGLTRMDAALIFEALATGCPSIAAYASIHNMVAWMVDRYGTGEQRARWLPGLCSMRTLAGYCLTEPGAGSDAAASLAHLRDLTTAFAAAGDSDASGIILAGAGPVFSAGHDVADVAETDLEAVRTLLEACLQLMELIESVPQPVIARVHGLATAAGCQLVATCDLAVAVDSAGFAAPGGKGGWVLPHPDGRYRPQHRPQTRRGAGLHR